MIGFLPTIRLGSREPIELLRMIMAHRGWREVCLRTWEIKAVSAIDLYGWDDDPRSPLRDVSQVTKFFPEHVAGTLPFRVSGERLVERSGLVHTLEDLELVRTNEEEPEGFDLELVYDTGPPGLVRLKDSLLHAGLEYWMSGSQ